MLIRKTLMPNTLLLIILFTGSNFSFAQRDRWAHVDTLLKYEKYEDANKWLMNIKDKARRKNNGPRYIKALKRIMFINYKKHENSDCKNLTFLQSELGGLKQPSKAIVHSLLAKVYHDVFEDMGWGEHKWRTFPQFDKLSRDSMRSIVYKHIINSVLPSELLKKTPSHNYLFKSSETPSVSFVSNLYNLLCRQGIYTLESYHLANIDSSSLVLAPPKMFQKVQIRDKSLKNLKCVLYQKLERNFLKNIEDQSNQKKLCYWYSKRLADYKYALQIPNKDSVLINSIKSFYNCSSTFSESGFVLLELGDFYARKGSYDNYNENSTLLLKADSVFFEIIKNSKNEISKNNAFARRADLHRKELTLDVEESVMPGDPFEFQIDYKNISKVYCALIDISGFYKKNEINSEYFSFPKYKFKERLKKYPIVNKWSNKLPFSEDLIKHNARLSTGGLESGIYAMIISSMEDFSIDTAFTCYRQITVSPFGLFNHNEGQQNLTERFSVVNRRDNLPISNADVKVYLKEYRQKKGYALNLLKSTTTDALGEFYFQFVSGKNHHIVISKGDNYFFADEYLYDERRNNNIGYSTYLYTDRKIYRPSQKVYFKGIMTKKILDNNEPQLIKNKKETISFYDANYSLIDSITVIGNEKGSYSGEFQIPTSLLNGWFQIKASHPDTKHSHSSINISVQEYKRPTFEVVLDPVKSNVQYGDSINFTGKAISFSGSEIKNAKIKYEYVFRQPAIWCREFGFENWGEESSIYSGETASDEKGDFFIPINFTDKNFGKIEGFLGYLKVQAIDITGESQECELNFKIGNLPVSYRLNIPEYVEKNSSRKIKYWIEGNNDEPVKRSGRIVIHKLKAPKKYFRPQELHADHNLTDSLDFVKNFPFDAFHNENEKTSWSLSQIVLDYSFESSSVGFVEFGANAWGPGDYYAEIQDSSSQRRDYSYFTVYNKHSIIPPIYTEDWVFLEEKKYYPNQIAELNIGSHDSINCFINIYKDDQLLKEERLSAYGRVKKYEIPILESYRGGIKVVVSWLKHDRYHVKNFDIKIPWDNKNLNVKLVTFRDQLSPGKEESITLNISCKNGELKNAELLATMYDESLDVFEQNSWTDFYFRKNNTYSTLQFLRLNKIGDCHQRYINRWHYKYIKLPLLLSSINYRNRIGSWGITPRYRHASTYGLYSEEDAWSDDTDVEYESEESKDFPQASFGVINSTKPRNNKFKRTKESMEFKEIQTSKLIRSNFDETAFFLPHLTPEKDGTIKFKFTVPESLTRWKLMAFAHDTTMKCGQLERSFTAQKQIMITAFTPRYFRSKDTVKLKVKIMSLANDKMKGVWALELKDQEDRDINLLNGTKTGKFKLESKSNIIKEVWFVVPSGINGIKYRVVAKTKKHDDGEEKLTPVLEDKTFITESIPFVLNGNDKKEIKIGKTQSRDRQLKKITIEVVDNPAWHAMQSLPYLIEFPHECSEQLFSRIFANAVALHIAKGYPNVYNAIKALGDEFNNLATTRLLTNPKLKNILIQETPWVLEAKSYQEQMKRLQLLLDFKNCERELDIAVSKLNQLQSHKGIEWFKGMGTDRYISSYIAAGIGQLEKIGLLNDKENLQEIKRKCIYWLDKEIRTLYKKKDNTEDKFNYIEIANLLYARSFFISKNFGKEFEYFKNYLATIWMEQPLMAQGKTALILHRFGSKNIAFQIIEALKQKALKNDSLNTMYWKEDLNSLYRYQTPVELHALMINVFDEILGDIKSIEKLKTWLILNKRGNHWRTTKSSTQAIYALLNTGKNWFGIKSTTTTKINGKSLAFDQNAQGDLGLYQKSWKEQEAEKLNGNFEIKHTGKGLSWGAVYVQYTDKIENIESSETVFTIQKKFYTTGDNPIELNSKQNLYVGQKLKVLITFQIDKNVEYIHVKDHRSSAFAPVNQMSSYQYGVGFGYYQNIKDASNDFFINRIRKGLYNIEYEVFVTHAGNFSNGPVTIESMYAPEFKGNSEGGRVVVD